MGIKPYREHLTVSDDLITSYEATRAGFIALALEKNRQATPFLAQARTLATFASQVKKPSELLNITDIHPALLTAAGISDKAIKYLQPEDKNEAIYGLIKNFLEPAGVNFVEELVFRFLLTRGDTLGGSMRNMAGLLAQRKLTRTIISTLKIAGKSYQWLHSINKKWATMPSDNDADIELHLKGLSWSKDEENRTLIYNLTVPLIKNNIDLCLLNCGPDSLSKAHSLPSLYIALGELKGGIDPAGADEHWKTARTALMRIEKAFTNLQMKPHTFFIGAAIQKKMATEIWSQLESGDLTNASNLTIDRQIASFARWLCNL